ncbi:GNAT family N-acetyltransferase [Tsuneonella suprasediminis]|uniref:GNAT family N-acetyltransferase n=1 Tax=Tsuneonella suprasediminis TaxID=2306996 RepID=A0A419QZL4_9SPHN|nr:GNAT family N-acetyltransferase [Tsuneonella suprasediminis]RJX66394.1 GNAT family N-acetyltransferase [Tsuneonella suprasediminis]
MMDDVDRIMGVMDSAFDPHWGEAWTRTQVGDSLVFPTTHYNLIASSGLAPAEGESAVGFTLVRAAPGEEELLLIGVTPEMRGQGLGRKLLDSVADQARLRKAEQVFLEMRENNPAIDLYRSFGFSPIGRRKNYYRISDGSILDAITFALPLT